MGGSSDGRVNQVRGSGTARGMGYGVGDGRAAPWPCLAHVNLTQHLSPSVCHNAIACGARARGLCLAASIFSQWPLHGILQQGYRTVTQYGTPCGIPVSMSLFIFSTPTLLSGVTGVTTTWFEIVVLAFQCTAHEPNYISITDLAC